MIEIKRMSPEHVSQISQMEQEFFTAGWSENSIRSELQNELALWLVAVDGTQVVGYIGSQTVLGESDMLNLAVRPEYRRHGIAKNLVENLMERLDASCLTLEVRESNTPARKLYETLGFQQVGVRKNYYEKPREDGLILRKEWKK